jgi:uncharacterized protein (TIGR02265 family)
MGEPARLPGGTEKRVPPQLHEEFVEPDYRLPLDVELRARSCPSSGAVKGMFFSAIADETRKRTGASVGREKYTAFRGYPLREWLEFLPAAARAAHPHHPPRAGMRRFGQGAFDVFTSSIAGRVLFSIAGRNIMMAVPLTARAFDVIGSHGSVAVVLNEPGRAVFALRDMWDYIDAWHVGIYEGALRAFGVEGNVRVRNYDHSNADLEVRYRPR